MSIHERSLESAASPAKIWSIWSDVSTWPTWNPDVRSISLDGPFASGTTGNMTTVRGTHDIRLDVVQPNNSFDLVTVPMPRTTFRFHCVVAPSVKGSRISQSVTMQGLLAPLVSPLMGNRIAAGFEPVLAGLARAAEAGR